MRPFEGIRVLDFTHVLAGPFATYQLAVMGADVIKIEPPGMPDMIRYDGDDEALNDKGLGLHFIGQNAGKRALSLDVATPEGRAIAEKLVATADVVVENYRAGGLAACGLGPAEAQKINPRLVYCSLTGFGQSGPKARHPAFDPVIQAFSGIMDCNGTPETRPIRIGPPLIDYGTGAQAAFAIAAALFQRDRTGLGQVIDIAMSDAATMMMSTYVMDTLATGTSPVPHGNHNPSRAGYSAYATADGTIMLGAYTMTQTARLWEVLGCPERAQAVAGQSWREVARDRAEDGALMAQILATKSAAEWEALLNEADVPAARVRRLDEALAMGQAGGRLVVQPVPEAPGKPRGLKGPVAAFAFAHDGPKVTRPAPFHGEHTAEVLAEMGIGPQAFQKLKGAGVV